jgi:hypothetical protein
MALKITGTSGYTADIDADGRLLINGPIVDFGGPSPLLPGRGPGFFAIAAETDPGAYTASRLILGSETDDDYRLRTGVDSLQFFEPFALITINSGTWSLTTSNMTVVVGRGSATLNSNAILTSGSYAVLNTLRSFALYSSFETRVVFQMMIQTGAAAGSAAPLFIANTVWEVGLYIASGVSAPTDGVFVRMNDVGQMSLIASFNGTETSAVVTTTDMLPFTSYQYEVNILPEHIELWIDNVLRASIRVNVPAPFTVPGPTISPALPFTARVYNSGVATQFTRLAIGPIEISTGAMQNSTRFYDRVAMSEQGGYQTQSGNTTPAQTANWTNSLVPGTAALANATASYTTMGGAFLFAAIAGAETDYCLFGFQVPADSVGGMNRDLVIRAVRIRTEATGGNVAAAGAVFQWGIAVGSNAVSLATVETTTTASAVKGPRRKALGMQGFPGSSVIGTRAQMINSFFGDSPLYCESGAFVQIILRVIVGTVGGGSLFRGTVDIDAQYE